MKKVLVALSAVLTLVSLGFHASFRYLHDPGLAKIGLAQVLVSLALAAALLSTLPKDTEPLGEPVHRLDLYLCLAALLAAFVLLLVGIKSSGPWSEETWWVEQAREILSGIRIHPVGFKDDHPANFQAWPAAFFMLLTRDPLLAVRLPGVLYVLATAGFCAATVRLFRPRAYLLPSFVLAAFGFTLLYYSHSGWNEMSIVPFLISGQLYFFAKAALLRSARALRPLAFFTAFGFWTLYTPFLFSLVVLGGLAVLPSSRIATRHKLLFGLAFLLIAAPTIGKMVSYPTEAMNRHEEFLQGGEWGRTFNDQYRPLPTYAANLGNALQHLLPPRGPIEDWNPTGIRLEPTTAALAVLGLLAAIRFSWLQRGILFGSFLLLLAGLVLSNPQSSLWRELCLIPFPLILAGLGWSVAVDGIRRWPGGRWVAPVAGGLLLVLHLGIWARRYEWFLSHHSGDPVGDAVMALHGEVRKSFHGSAGVAVPDIEGNLVWRYYNTLEYEHRVPPLRYRELAELESLLRNRQVGAVVTSPQENCPSPEVVGELLARNKVKFTRKAVLDRLGRPAGWVFFVS